MTDIIVAQEAQEKKQEQGAVQPQPPRDRIAIWYHNSDLNLMLALDKYMQLLSRRLGDQFHLAYFGYPKEMPKEPTPYTGESKWEMQEYEKKKKCYGEEAAEYQKNYGIAVNTLEHCAALLVLCTSNPFVSQFWTDIERDTRLSGLLKQPDFPTMTVPLRPTGTGEIHPSEPLCAYEGYHLEAACQRIASMVEAALHDHYPERIQAQTPLDALLASSVQMVIPSPMRDTTIEVISSTLEPVQVLLEQASRSITEAQKLALAERSQREIVQESGADLRRQLEQMKEQVTAIQAEQNRSPLAKLGRRLGIHSSK